MYSLTDERTDRNVFWVFHDLDNNLFVTIEGKFLDIYDHITPSDMTLYRRNGTTRFIWRRFRKLKKRNLSIEIIPYDSQTQLNIEKSYGFIPPIITRYTHEFN